MLRDYLRLVMLTVEYERCRLLATLVMANFKGTYRYGALESLDLADRYKRGQ